MTAYLHQFTNAADGVTAMVFVSNHKAGGFGVSLRDDDAGEFVGVSHHGLTLEAAIAKAQAIAGLIPFAGRVSVAI